MTGKFSLRVLGIAACVLALPALAAAQSQITGQVRDESGGVLPGVSVEAASPVLIEKLRTAVTDDQGRFNIVDLRPGLYKVTFSLPGFSTVVRDAIDLPSNFTATVNADMKVGALEETITVSGQTPMVDVQQAARTQVLTRDIIDNLPTTRNIMSVGILVPGIRMGTPDIGGSRAMEQPAMRVHGVNQRETNQLVDGMSINSNEDCLCMSYADDAMQSEVTVTTSALPAESSPGGIRVNSIPKDGGNVVSGAIFIGGTDGEWQANNVDDELRARRIQSANGIAHIQNFNGSLGGPIMNDRLWYFLTARHASSDETVANVEQHTIAPDGEFIRSILDQYIRDAGLRLTYQATGTQKVAGFFQRVWKRKGKDFTFGQDPRAATQRDPHTAHYGVGHIKWTMAPNSRLLFEGGYSTSYQHWTGGNQIGRFQERNTPLWYQFAQKSDTALNINPDCAYSFGCTSWGSVAQNRTEATRAIYAFSTSYVTGSHNLKVGVQHAGGPSDNYSERNADLQQNYSNGRPSTVTVYNTPVITRGRVNRDLGIYAQDSWTIKRLTVSPGLRVEYFNSSMKETSMPAGRFVPARFFTEQTDLPNWKNDLAPRLSAAYDVFGDGRTAIKGNASKYHAQWSAGWAKRYASSASSSDTRSWFDCPINAAGTACSGVVLPTNGDNIAQDSEIGPRSSPTFGLRSDRNPAPGIERTYNWEYSAAVQHQLTSRVSMSVAWYRRIWKNLEVSDRELISTADYTSFQVPMPSFANDADLVAPGVLDPAEMLTIYNLNTAKRGVYGAQIVDKNSDDQSIYDGVEVSFSSRLPAGGTLFGGWTIQQNLSVFCASDDNPNGPTTADLFLGDNVATGGRFCDQREFDVPMTHEFKLAGNYPLPLGFDFGAILQSYAGRERVITWQPAPTAFPGGRTNAETIILTKPGALYYPRYNQLDLNLKKTFRAGRKTFTGQIDFFNALNGNAIFSQNNAIGASLGQVTAILQGRMMRLGFQMKF